MLAVDLAIYTSCPFSAMSCSILKVELAMCCMHICIYDGSQWTSTGRAAADSGDDIVADFF